MGNVIMTDLERWDAVSQQAKTAASAEALQRATKRIGRKNIVWARSCSLKNKPYLFALTSAGYVELAADSAITGFGTAVPVEACSARADGVNVHLRLDERVVSAEFATPEDASDVAIALERAQVQTAAARARLYGQRPPRKPLSADQREMLAVIYLGGTDSGLLRGSTYDLRLSPTSIEIYGQAELEPRRTLDTAGLRDAQLSGRGAWQKGGGFIGGGFGAVGAAEGMLIAGALNAITTKRGLEAILTLSHSDGEFWFLSTSTTPEVARLELAPLFHALGSKRASTPTEKSTHGADLVSRLQQLSDLHASGALTTEEFNRAKAQILGT